MSNRPRRRVRPGASQARRSTTPPLDRHAVETMERFVAAAEVVTRTTSDRSEDEQRDALRDFAVLAQDRTLLQWRVFRDHPEIGALVRRAETVGLVIRKTLGMPPTGPWSQL